MKALFLIILFSLLVFTEKNSYSQICNNCICGTPDIAVTGFDPDTITGGRYKPERSDLNNNNPDNYFPILVLFVQFKNETGDSTTTKLLACTKTTELFR
ncbi:MAG: hypothetical protein ABIY50_12465 [Ignavibacteria bacterium]